MVKAWSTVRAGHCYYSSSYGIILPKFKFDTGSCHCDSVLKEGFSSCFAYVFICFCSKLSLFGKEVSCSPGWPEIHHAALKDSLLPGLQACNTTHVQCWNRTRSFGDAKHRCSAPCWAASSEDRFQEKKGHETRSWLASLLASHLWWILVVVFQVRENFWPFTFAFRKETPTVWTRPREMNLNLLCEATCGT